MSDAMSWRQRLRKKIPPQALKEVHIGSWSFTSIEAYFALEIADSIFGPWGQGYWLQIHDGFPKVLQKEVVTSGLFFYVDPDTGERCREGIQVSGGCKIVHGIGFAMKGAETSCISNALSRLMFGIEIYSGGKISPDTYGMHHAWGEADTGGAAGGSPATTRANQGDRREAPPAGSGRPPSSGHRPPPIGWVPCKQCGKHRKPFYNDYGPYIICDSCGEGDKGLFTNLSIDQAEVAAEAGLWGDRGWDVVERLRNKIARAKRGGQNRPGEPQPAEYAQEELPSDDDAPWA